MSNDKTVFIGCQTVERDIPLSKLVIVSREDGGFQRVERDRKTREIAENFDWMLWDKPEVAEIEDGLYSITNGQHRCGALRIMFPNHDSVIVRCDVKPGTVSLQEQAKRFVAQFTATEKISPHDQFHALVVAGDEDAVAYKAMLDRLGLRAWTGGSCKKGYASPVLYRHFVEKFGPEGMNQLSEGLECAVSAWGRDIRFHTEAIRAICACLRHWTGEPEFSRVLFIEGLKRTTANDLVKKLDKTETELEAGAVVTALVVIAKLYNHDLPEKKWMLVTIGKRVA